MPRSRSIEVKDAPFVMKERGEETDQEVLSFISTHPEATVSEIAFELEMSNGKVDGSIKRLEDKREIQVQYYRRNRGLVKKIKLINEIDHQYDEISFPLKSLNKKLWKEKAFFCALSRSAIKITPEENIIDDCILVKESTIKKVDKNILVKIPEAFVNFYELPNSEIDVSGIGNELFLTIDSTVIPLDVPQNYEPEGEYSHYYAKLHIGLDVKYDVVERRYRGGPQTTGNTNVNVLLLDLLKSGFITVPNSEEGVT